MATMEVDKAHSTPSVSTVPVEPTRGLPKSGRWWKDPKKTKNQAINKVKPLHSKWDKKMAERAKNAMVKAMQQDIRDKQLQEKKDKVERRKEQEERRKENEKKGEIVQIIRNTEKLKKMKKKQIRRIEKRDTN